MADSKKKNDGNEDKNEEDPSSSTGEKYFDGKNYSTLIVGSDKFTTPEKLLIEEVIAALTSGDHSLKDEALQELKDQEAQQALIDAIEDDEYKKHRQLLIAACWESGLDFSAHTDVFMELAGDKDAMTSLEAITVLEQIDHFESKEALQRTIRQIDALIVKHPAHEELLKDLSARWKETVEEM
jgi:hypothetical protein